MEETEKFIFHLRRGLGERGKHNEKMRFFGRMLFLFPSFCSMLSA